MQAPNDNWKNTLKKILSKHLDEDSLDIFLKGIEESSWQTKHGLPPIKGNGYAMPVGMSAYICSFMKIFPESMKLLIYSFDEKGGLSPNISVLPITDEDLKTLESVEEWPTFNINDLSRIREAPFMKEIQEEEGL